MLTTSSTDCTATECAEFVDYLFTKLAMEGLGVVARTTFHISLYHSNYNLDPNDINAIY